jgi:hypothetical protein
VRSTRRKDHELLVDNLVCAGSSSGVEKYLANLDEKRRKDLYFSNLITSQGEVLMELSTNTYLKLLYFKK